MLVIVHGVGLAVTGWGAGKGKGVHGTVRTFEHRLAGRRRRDHENERQKSRSGSGDLADR